MPTCSSESKEVCMEIDIPLKIPQKILHRKDTAMK